MSRNHPTTGTNILHFNLTFPLNGDASLQSLLFLIETKRSF